MGAPQFFLHVLCTPQKACLVIFRHALFLYKRRGLTGYGPMALGVNVHISDRLVLYFDRIPHTAYRKNKS